MQPHPDFVSRMLPRSADLGPFRLATVASPMSFACGNLGSHQGDDFKIDGEIQFHSGLKSTVHTSRSRSRTGSP